MHDPYPMHRLRWQFALKADDEWMHKTVLFGRLKAMETLFSKTEIVELLVELSALGNSLKVTDESLLSSDGQRIHVQTLRRLLITSVAAVGERLTTQGQRTMQAFAKCLNDVTPEEEEYLEKLEKWDWQGMIEEKDIDLRRWLADEGQAGNTEWEDEQEHCNLPILKRACAFKSEYHYLKKAFAQKEKAATSTKEKLDWKEARQKLMLIPGALGWDGTPEAPADAEAQRQEEEEEEHIEEVGEVDRAVVDPWEAMRWKHRIEWLATVREGRYRGGTRHPEWCCHRCGKVNHIEAWVCGYCQWPRRHWVDDFISCSGEKSRLRLDEWGNALNPPVGPWEPWWKDPGGEPPGKLQLWREKYCSSCMVGYQLVLGCRPGEVLRQRSLAMQLRTEVWSIMYKHNHQHCDECVQGSTRILLTRAGRANMRAGVYAGAQKEECGDHQSGGVDRTKGAQRPNERGAEALEDRSDQQGGDAAGGGGMAAESPDTVWVCSRCDMRIPLGVQACAPCGRQREHLKDDWEGPDGTRTLLRLDPDGCVLNRRWNPPHLYVDTGRSLRPLVLQGSMLKMWTEAQETWRTEEDRVRTDKAIAEVMCEELQLELSETSHPEGGQEEGQQPSADYIEDCPTQEGRLQGETWQRRPYVTPPEESAKQDALTSQDAWDDVRTALTKAALDKTVECIPVPPPCSSFVRARKKARRSGTHQQGRKRKQEEKGTNPEEQRAPGQGERESEGNAD